MKYWILQGQAATAMAADPVALAYFSDPNITVLFPATMTPPPSWTTIPYVTFTRFVDFQNAIQNSTVNPAAQAVMYDSEQWAFTPSNEQADPIGYTRLFAALAHAHGLKVISALAVNLMSILTPTATDKYGAYVSYGLATGIAPYVDFYHIQSQGSEASLSKYTPFVQQVTAQARAASSSILVTSGISTGPNGQTVTRDQIVAAVRATQSFVDGYWLNIPQQSPQCPSCGAFNPQLASDALAQLTAPIVLPGPQLTSNGIPSLEAADNVTIVRRTQSGETYTSATIYSGNGNMDASAGSTFYDPLGVVDKADAMLILEPIAGALPGVMVDDIVTVDGFNGEYVVVLASPHAFPPAHLELHLKRGPISYIGGKT